MIEKHILGCGPAGLLAAHAVSQAGFSPVIHSIKEPSHIKGAQFIHKAIPGITKASPDCMVMFEKRGAKENYALKVYGDASAPTSWDDFPAGPVKAWSMTEVYQKLWSQYEECIIDTEIREPYINDLISTGLDVFSSITPLGYCFNGHAFEWQDVWIVNRKSFDSKEDNAIVYNGVESDSWYRSSSIMGHDGTEYGQTPGKTRASRKPLSTNCDCFMDQANFYRIGRFGEFRKGLLVHDAYRKVSEVLNAL